MRQHFQRFFAILIIMVLLFGNTPNIEASAMNQSDFNSKLSSFKATRYNNNSTYIDNPSKTGGYQCFGFANELALWIFDSYPTSSMSAYTVNSGWSRTYGSAGVDNLSIGDIVRYKYHSIFITGISGDTIYFAQANVPSGTNKVTYDNSISRNTLKSYCNAQLTHSGATTQGWVAHCNNGVITSHTHSYSEGYEAVHPHRVYMKCSCGEFYYTGSTTTMSGCADCLKPTNVILLVDQVKKTTAHQWETIEFHSSADNVETYVIGIDFNGKRILTKSVPRYFYYKCEEPGNYTAYVSASNSYGYTDSNKVSFTVTPHTYDNGKITKAATCAETGVKTYTCTVSGCNATKTETISKVSTHKWDNGITTKSATCSSNGIKTFTCSICKKQKTESIAALGHSYKSVVTPPTCTAQGYTTFTCTRSGCGYSYKSNYTNAKGHTPGEWKITKEPTITSTGSKTLYCKDCGQAVKTETIPKLVQPQSKVHSVAINDMELNYKQTGSLNPIITADSGTSYKVNYTSSNPNIASLDNNGNIYAAKRGSAKITVTVTDSYGNSVTDDCIVNVDYSGFQWFIIIVLFGWIWYI